MPPPDDIQQFRALSAQEHQRLRRRSKLLMGNLDRLEVAVAIAASEDGLVNATELSGRLGIANNRVRANLLAFADVGLLAQAPPVQSGGYRWFIRQPSPFWGCCRQLYREWTAESGSAQSGAGAGDR